MDYWSDLLEQDGNPEDNLGRMIWPERSSIDPSACRDHLGDIFILDTDNNQCDFRLAGTRICDVFGRELKQTPFFETFADRDQQAAQNWVGQMSNDNYCVLICGDGITHKGDVVALEMLLMPLNHMGKRGRRVLGTMHALETPYWLGAKPVKEIVIRSVRVLRPWEDKVFKQNAHNALPDHGTAVANPSREKLSFAELSRKAAEFDAPTMHIANIEPHPKASHLRVFDGGKV